MFSRGKNDLFDPDKDYSKKWDWNKMVISPENKCKVAFEIILSFMALF